MFFLISDYKNKIYSVVGVSTETFTHIYYEYNQYVESNDIC